MARQKSEIARQCEAVGVSVSTIRYRMRKGLSFKEALSMPTRETRRQGIVYDRNRPQIVQADMSWQAVRNCIKSLDNQVRMFERIIALIKEDPEGGRIYDRAMREMVEGGK